MGPDVGYIPPPPPKPEYDPKEEPSKWSWSRLFFNLPLDKGGKEWTKPGSQPKNPDDPDWRGVVRKNVTELPMPEPYKFGNKNNPKYFWFDTPDYADPSEKLKYATKWLLKSSLLLMCGKGAFFGGKFTIPYHVELLRTVGLPWFLSGLAGSSTVIIVSNLRGKKDDMWNYVAGGLVMGSILGRKNYYYCLRFITLMTSCFVISKYNAEINGQLVPMNDFRTFNFGPGGMDSQHGIFSGDFRLGLRLNHGDPGRDLRRVS